MQRAGTQSWLIAQGPEHAAELALYVRDALALSVSTEPEIPLLEPVVPVNVPAGVDRAAATEEWPGWWADVLAAAADQWSDPPSRFATYPGRQDSPALAHRPAVRAALQALEPTAARHSGPRGPLPHHQRDLGRLVRAREAELGRTARPFRLVITELPVAGLLCHRLAAGHVLMSVRFAGDTARSDAALREIIAELA